MIVLVSPASPFTHEDLAVAQGCLTLNGEPPVFEDNEMRPQDGFSDRTQVISRDLQFSCRGNVTGWAAYAESAGTFATINFQVWRLAGEDVNTECQTYQLVGSHSFSNVLTDANKLLNITSLNGQRPIPVKPGDVVGFYGDFNGSRNTNIQSTPSASYVSYYYLFVSNSNTYAYDLTDQEANTCSDLAREIESVPVITAYVATEGKRLLKLIT